MALQTSPAFAALTQLINWAKTPLQHTVCRVNTLRISPQEALKEARLLLAKEASRRGRTAPAAQLHPLVPEALIISAWPDRKPLMEPYPDRADCPKVFVDRVCGNAVLRGAPVFNGGVLAITESARVGDTVAIHAFHQGHKQWLAYGTLRSFPLTPEEYAEKVKTSDIKQEDECVVEIDEGLSVLPPLPHEMIERGELVHQVLPAILTSRVVNPQPGERVLNLGCGTGVLTTHLAALACNKADVVAVDFSVPRLNTLVHRCKLTGAKVTPVAALAQDFVKEETSQFDRVLVEADSSGFGQRPTMPFFAHLGRGINTHAREFVENAVKPLKPGGHLVFCTNSAMPIENDATVRWLLDNCNVKLKAAEPRLAPVGVRCPIPRAAWMMLSPEEEKAIQRFGIHTAELESDPINRNVSSYFIACFVKTC